MSQPVKNNSQLLYLQARQLFEQAKSKFEDGSIKSDASLIQSVFNSFQAFFTSMGKPNMIPRYAPEEGPPWSEDYNSMMNEIRQDLELLFQEVDILGRSLYTDFNHNMIQHDILMSQYQTVLDKMKDLETFAGIGDAGVDFGRDDFLNKDKIDYARIAGTPLEIVDGAVTLPQVSRENVAEKAAITIVTGNRQQNKFILGTESNGFPGNNTEIHSVTDDVLTNQNYIPTFLGEEDNHGDYSVVLDGNPNTWFEYEKVNVREQDKIRGAKNLGWSYQVHENQSIEWAEDPDGGILKLHMQMVLEEEAIINQINCNMYTPPNYGAKEAIVKNILVSDGNSAPVSVLTSDKKDDQYSFHFPPVKAKVISIQFEQPNKYITDIGHIFYEKKMQSEDNSEYAMDVATKKYQYAPRVEGPLISLEDLGISVKVTDNNVSAEYPSVETTNSQITNIGETINRLTSNIDMETIDMGVEKFEGFRWAIGIRDIEVFSCEYAEEGELVTYPFYFENPLDKISLNVDENIPSTFTSNDAMKYDWLTYYISIDDGATWNPITPLTHQSTSADQPPKIYTVHTIETADQQLENKQAYLESEYPVYSLRLKIVGKRPSDYTTEGFLLKDSAGTTSSFTQSSPIVSSYLLDIKTKIEASDSDESLRIVTHIEDLTGETGDDSEGNDNDGGIDYGGVDGGSGNNGNTGGVSEEVIGPNPWGDDDNDGRPNWDDPEHVYYIPPNIRPTPGWEPPGRPENSDYPEGGIPPVIGGPLEDDDGDGIANYKDPDWRPSLTAEITNKKTEWCSNEDLHIKGNLYTGNNLIKAELYVNGKITQTIPLSGKYTNYDFTIPANTFEPNTVATIVVRVYDSMKSFFDTDVINIIDCANMAEEDKPQEQSSNDNVHVVIDKKVDKICECDTLAFYGTVQGPNPIRALIVRINGSVIDIQNMGTPPVNDPCLSSQVVPQFFSDPVKAQVETKQITDEELLEIDDFGEWLEAFEEREDCGCRNKKKKQMNTFQMQSSPVFTTMATNEEVFQASIPYWKLRQLGAVVGKETKVEITAIDITNQQAVESFEFLVEDCENPPYDEEGNPRIADCKGLESVEVYYYDGSKQSIQSSIIPSNAIPYQINNGQGIEITVGWREEAKSPILMITNGWDESGYAFQVHAVAVNYLDEYGKSYKLWASELGENSEGIKNGHKMLGDASRQPVWVEDILNGDYSTAPSLAGINDYVDFVFDASIFGDTLCEMDTIPYFDVGSNAQPTYPPSKGSNGESAPYSCWNATHILFQYYDDQFDSLRLLKVDITTNGKDIYTIQTKNGNVELAIGWVGYFNAPAIQIKSATGDQNVLLTSLGVTFQDYYGDSETMWIEKLRYKTSGVNNPDLVLGELKDISSLSWLNGNVVDYENAAYIGKQGDLVSYSLNEEVIKRMCPPAKTIDELLSLDFNDIPDRPVISFENIPENNEILFNGEEVIVKGKITDATGLKEVTYYTLLNGMDYMGPYTEEIEGFDYTIDFAIRPDQLQVGDTVRLYIQATNEFDVYTVKSEDLWIVQPEQTVPSEYRINGSGPNSYEQLIYLGEKSGVVQFIFGGYQGGKISIYYKNELIAEQSIDTSGNEIESFYDYSPTDGVYEIKIIREASHTSPTGNTWYLRVYPPISE